MLRSDPCSQFKGDIACGILEFKDLAEAENVQKRLNGRKIADHDGRITAVIGDKREGRK